MSKLSIDPRVCGTCQQTRTQGDFISDSGQPMAQCCYCASKAASKGFDEKRGSGVVNTMIPTVHLNGSAGSVLQKQNEDALKAVESTIELLCIAAPHGRDYYPQDVSTETLADAMIAYRRAEKQHSARLTALSAIRDELREIVRGVRRQNEARNPRRS